MQPLIENAIQHGLTPERPQNIEVLGYLADEETIRLQVSDDGEGMTAEALMRRPTVFKSAAFRTSPPL